MVKNGICFGAASKQNAFFFKEEVPLKNASMPPIYRKGPENVFGVSCLVIWWGRNIWISEKLKFDYLKNEKKPLKWNKKQQNNKTKHFFLFHNCLPLDLQNRLAKM